MKKTVPPVTQARPMREELPARVQEALGELAAAAREGLLALSVGVGLGVLAELMEEEVVEVVGVKGKHDRERVAVRHGHEAGAVTLGAVLRSNALGSGQPTAAASSRWRPTGSSPTVIH
jgi:hypothetical protein